jgi:hypothetical protein
MRRSVLVLVLRGSTCSPRDHREVHAVGRRARPSTTNRTRSWTSGSRPTSATRHDPRMAEGHARPVPPPGGAPPRRASSARRRHRQIPIPASPTAATSDASPVTMMGRHGRPADTAAVSTFSGALSVDGRRPIFASDARRGHRRRVAVSGSETAGGTQGRRVPLFSSTA